MGQLSRTQKMKNIRKKLKTIQTQKEDPPVAVAEFEEEEDIPKPIKKVFLPNNTEFTGNDQMQQNTDDLIYDPSAYQVYHEFDLGFPSLSFAIVPNNQSYTDPEKQTKTLMFVAGSQLDNIKENQIVLGNITNLKYKKISENLDESSSRDEEEEVEEDEPHMKTTNFKHNGVVNKIAMSSFFNNDLIATWSSTGVVNVFEIGENLKHLSSSYKPRKTIPNKNPIYTFTGHTDEGYALDWSHLVSGRLASGSCDSTIAIWKPNEHSWNVDCLCSSRDFGHKGSVECLQWSPNEADILASCGCDGFIRIWDIRVFNSQPVMSTHAHPGVDVNVISWNGREPLVVSGDDVGMLKVWDIRHLSAAASVGGNQEPLCTFGHHKKAITSVEWHPTDGSIFMSSGEDDQLAIWDLSVDVENIERGNLPEEVAPQLLFIHMGQEEIKECHWHPNNEGMIMSTAFKSFNIFKTISV